MKLSAKIIIISLLAIFFSIYNLKTHAQYANCDKVNASNYKSIVSENRDKLFGKLLPRKDVLRSLDNLRSYCCRIEFIKQCQEETSPGAESPFLFDHILDMYLRRLDAKQDDETGKSLSYTTSMDPTGQAWRERINTHANSEKSTTPLLISNEYKKYRTLSYEKKQNLKQWTDRKPYDIDLKEINNSFEKWNLINKYSYACEISMSIYFQLQGVSSLNIKKTDTDYDMENYYRVCKEMIVQRIQQENEYVKAVLQHKGNQSLHKYMESYMSAFFVQNRLTNLKNTIYTIDSARLSIYKAVPKLIPQCM